MKRRSIATGGVQHAEANTNGEHPTVFKGCKSEPTQTERKSSERTQHRLGSCDNIVFALKLLAKQQQDGDSPIQSIVTGLQERSRKTHNGREQRSRVSVKKARALWATKAAWDRGEECYCDRENVPPADAEQVARALTT